MSNLSLRQLFYKSLAPNAIILEAGAHIGRDTVRLAEHFNLGTIHAFEPVTSLYKKLCNSVKHLSNVRTYPYALSNKNGVANYFESSGRSTAVSSLLEPTGYLQEHPRTNFAQIEVNTITIDSWMKQYNIDRIDGMWLDMQGGELRALEGAEEILSKVTAIYTEITLVERYKNNPLKADISSFLAKKGFELIEEDLFKKTWGNALFIAKKPL